MIKPKRLRKGDTIGVISPAGPSSTDKAAMKVIKNLEGYGFKIKLGRNALNRTGYLAGSDKQRLSDIHKMFKDPKVDAIICFRGGYGTQRLLKDIDFDIIKKNPKIFVGYSDITGLHLAFTKKTGLVTFHGPMVASHFIDKPEKYSLDNLFDILMNPQKEKMYPVPKRWNKIECVNKGVAEGRLSGGNLTLIATLVGTPYAIDTKNKIVFFEEVGEESYRIDRDLTQLLNSGKLADAAGFVIGINKGCEPGDKKRPSSREVIIDRLKSLKKPMILGFPFGHIQEQITIPYGIKARLDAKKGTLTLLEKCVK